MEAVPPASERSTHVWRSPRDPLRDVQMEKGIVMPTEGQFTSNNGGRPNHAGAEHPACPQCQRRMTVRQISPVLFASELDDVVYGCDGCGAVAKRTVKRT